MTRPLDKTTKLYFYALKHAHKKHIYDQEDFAQSAIVYYLTHGKINFIWFTADYLRLRANHFIEPALYCSDPLHYEMDFSYLDVNKFVDNLKPYHSIVFRLLLLGFRQNEVARIFNISPSRISRIIKIYAR